MSEGGRDKEETNPHKIENVSLPDAKISTQQRLPNTC